MPKRERLDLLAFLCLSLLSAACGEGTSVPVEAGQASADETVVTQPVVREILGRVDDPRGAPHRRLTLVRYTIAAGAELVPHLHPGVQMASMVSGVLTYRVISGTATIHRTVDPNGVALAVERVVGPADTELHPGDLVVEDSSMVHFGSNRTSEPVVILAALITDPRSDLSAPAVGRAE